ncbi:hypothetical protein MAY91_05445 [Edwardsiella ictaluri]|uniref:Uncharacterized protein n=1 Tax=Edwardsiella ictaluri TaxID=67780 RepID=A0ABY8GJL1_EDWIC|nr:hypothetical protein [Edwardsiella ictaluri]WFN97488.1 hypothetical protein MAY91_05445 [Edwardsiella ictaluri]
MGGGHWRLGIDIQPAQLVAVALSARRDGIQLRGWWRLPLTVDPDRDGLSPSLPATLTTLRARLPRRLSVRAAFPAERAIRDMLPGSTLPLTPWQRHRLLLAQGERQLMLPAHQLACDFAPAPEGGRALAGVCRAPRAARSVVRAVRQRRLTAAALNAGTLCIAAFGSSGRGEPSSAVDLRRWVSLLLDSALGITTTVWLCFPQRRPRGGLCPGRGRAAARCGRRRRAAALR